MCENCKLNAVALEDVRRDLMIANGQLARLLACLGVPPAPDGKEGVLRLTMEWRDSVDAKGEGQDV